MSRPRGAVLRCGLRPPLRTAPRGEENSAPLIWVEGLALRAEVLNGIGALTKW